MAKEKHASLRSNPVAVALGLDEPNGPSVILEQAIDALGRGGGSGVGVGGARADGSGEVNVLYMYLLDACEKVFDNELDQATFEEHMRWFFGTKVRSCRITFVYASFLSFELGWLGMQVIFTLLLVVTGIPCFHFGQGHHDHHQTGESRRPIYMTWRMGKREGGGEE